MQQGQNSTARDTSSSRKTWYRQALGIIISLVCLWLTVRNVNGSDVYEALRHLQWSFVLLGICSLAIGYAARIQRWKLMLNSAGSNISFSKCAAPFLGSITLNNVLPLRAGDVVRAFVFPAAIGVNKTDAVASIFLERLIDLLTLLMCLGLGLLFSPSLNMPSWLTDMATVLTMLGIALLLCLMTLDLFVCALAEKVQSYFQTKGFVRIANLLDVINGILRSLKAMSGFSKMSSLLLLSAIVWAGESGLYYFILMSLKIEFTGPFIALTVMAIATLSTLVPSSPGYVGPFHLAASSTLLMLGADQAEATSFAFIAHLGVWLPTTLAGSLAMLSQPKLFNGRAESAQVQNIST